MDSSPIIIPPHPLTTFCQTVIDKHSANWPITEDILAQELVGFFGLQSIAHFEDVQKLCLRLGIEASRVPLPQPLRGYNFRYGESRKVFVSEHQSFIGADQHTALHELREHLEYEFQALGYPTLNGNDSEEQAEHFAMQVRMNVFQKQLPVLFKDASQIESKWPRRATYMFTAILSFFYLLGLVLLPTFEDLADRKP